MIPLYEGANEINFTEAESTMWLPGLSRENGEFLFNVYRVLVIQDEKVLELCSTNTYM